MPGSVINSGNENRNKNKVSPGPQGTFIQIEEDNI